MSRPATTSLESRPTDIEEDDWERRTFNEWFFDVVGLPATLITIASLLLLTASGAFWLTVRVWIAILALLR